MAKNIHNKTIIHALGEKTVKYQKGFVFSY